MTVSEQESLRTFIALELPDWVKLELNDLEKSLKILTDVPARWVPAKNIHITIIFLGQVARSKIQSIEKVVSQAAGKCERLHLQLSTLGAFPNLMRPRTLWVGLDGDVAKLLLLHKSLKDNMGSLGFNIENRPFNPHLTLARIGNSTHEASFRSLAEAAGLVQIRRVSFEIKRISLMESRLLPGGAAYSTLFSKEFES
jgi:2'-5' RNA ligase